MTLSPVFLVASVPTFPSRPLAGMSGEAAAPTSVTPTVEPGPTPCLTLLGTTSQKKDPKKSIQGKERDFLLLLFVAGTSTLGTH